MTTPAGKTTREHGLDALRGVAAMNVFVLHLLTTFWMPPYPDHARWAQIRTSLESTPLSLVWAGEQAVLLFFMLSGFALYRMLNVETLSYPRFAIRRFFRLWVPYVFALGVSIVAMTLVEQTTLRNSIWLAPDSPSTLTSDDVWQHLLMIGQFDTFKICGVVWSLVHEMRMSLVFPLLYASLRRWGSPPVLVASLALAVPASSFENPVFIPGELSSWWRTGYYQLYFVVGAVIAHDSSAVKAMYRSLRTTSVVATSLLALTLYSDCLHILSRCSVLVGAIWIVIAATSSQKLGSLLRAQPLQLLGRISYSLYLLHRVVLVTAVNALFPRWGLPAITALAVAPAFILAYFSWRFIEEPANRLGRTLAARWTRPAERVVLQ